MKQANKYYVFTCIYFMYKRAYRKALILLGSLIILSRICAQENNLDGYWRGILFTGNDSAAFRIYLAFNNNKLVGFSTDYGNRKWFKKRYLKSFIEDAGITVIGKMKKNGQVRSDQYTITPIEPGTATVSWRRGSKAVGENARNNTPSWLISGTGYIQKDEP